MTTLSELYDTRMPNLREVDDTNYFRPTLKQFFTSTPDWHPVLRLLSADPISYADGVRTIKAVGTVTNTDGSAISGVIRPTGIQFNPDGTKAYIPDYDTGKIRTVPLNTPYLVSSKGTPVVTTGFPACSISFVMSNDGTKVFLGTMNNFITILTLNVPWNFAGGWTETTHSFATKVSHTSTIWFDETGTHFYLASGYSSLAVHHWQLSTPWNLATKVYKNYLNVNARHGESNVYGIAIVNSGNTILLSVDTPWVYEYTLSTPYSMAGASYTSEVSSGYVYDITMRPNSNKFYTAPGAFSISNNINGFSFGVTAGDWLKSTNNFYYTNSTTQSTGLTDFKAVAASVNVTSSIELTVGGASTATSLVFTHALPNMLAMGDIVVSNTLEFTKLSSVVQTGTGPYTYTCIPTKDIGVPTSARKLVRLYIANGATSAPMDAKQYFSELTVSSITGTLANLSITTRQYVFEDGIRKISLGLQATSQEVFTGGNLQVWNSPT